jgi:hypothetical protein
MTVSDKVFLRELNEEGIIELYWILTEANSSNLFKKNLSGPIFEKHTATYCGVDEYMTPEHHKKVRWKNPSDSQGEGVGE